MQIPTSGTVLFAFPSISLAPPSSAAAEATPGFLVLSTETVTTETGEEDCFLRVRFTPDNASLGHPVDTLISARETLSKIAPNHFTLSSEFGDLTIIFPGLQEQIPLQDERIEIPKEVRQGMVWGEIVRSFETEVDRWVVYRKNRYSLTDGFGGIEKGAGGGAYGYDAAPGEGSTMMQGGIPPYDPRDYNSSKGGQGKIVLVDEENGNEVGEVGGMAVHAEGIKPGSKDPVVITMPETPDGTVTVSPAEPEFLRDALHPSYQKSTLVSTAVTASRLLVTTTSYLASAIHSGANTFTQKTQPAAQPVTFQPATHERFEQLHTLSKSAAHVSSVTIGKVTHYAQNAGARLAGKNADRAAKGVPRNPSLLNKSLIAFETLADGLDHAGKTLLGAGAGAATKIVGHRYGDDARRAAENITGSVRNVGLVYIDASGVSRRAVIKGVAKGMVVGRVRGGGEVIVPGEGDEAIVKTTLTPGGSPAPAATPPPGYGDAAAMYFPPPPKSDGSRSPVPSYKR